MSIPGKKGSHVSGHSKWASIKHKKAATDAKRGKLFSKLSRAITVAAREGGGNPDMNITLASAVQKARDNSMPADNIDRAIKRGTGEIEGANYEEITYEAYAPGGVALVIEVMTDNRNRAASDVRSTVTRAGGTLAATGATAWMFDRRGQVLAPVAGNPDEEEITLLAADAGAEDIAVDGEMYDIDTEPTALGQVRKALEDAGIRIDSEQLTLVPKQTVELDVSAAKKVLRLMDALDDIDDVQDVYANFDLTEDVMAQLDEG
jgi:YebC/PmpR family DNA-binding regulatory protein